MACQVSTPICLDGLGFVELGAEVKGRTCCLSCLCTPVGANGMRLRSRVGDSRLVCMETAVPLLLPSSGMATAVWLLVQCRIYGVDNSSIVSSHLFQPLFLLPCLFTSARALRVSGASCTASLPRRLPAHYPCMALCLRQMRVPPQHAKCHFRPPFGLPHACVFMRALSVLSATPPPICRSHFATPVCPAGLISSCTSVSCGLFVPSSPQLVTPTDLSISAPRSPATPGRHAVLPPQA